MGGKALLAVLWLISAWTVTGSPVKDNVSAESAPRLYRNVPQGVYASAYASAAPYGAFSFHVPAAVPAAKGTQLIPVKQESIVIQNSNGFLKDSYGNKFVETPQSVAYKTTFPQQFVQLQHLPAHLSQPLAAAPTYHFPQGPPQAFFGAQYRLPSVDTVTTPLTRYGAFAQPFVYAGGVKSLTPASDQQFHFGTPTKAQQDSSNNKLVYASQGYSQLQNEPKFQRLEEYPRQSENYEAPRQQAAPSLKAKVQTPVKHTVKTTHNGQDTVVQIETKPPLPLLDLSLLEPLTFANPIVPQVQHYLPKINAVTYSKLHPSDDVEVKNHKEFVVQKTKSYDSGVVKGKPHSDEPKRKQKKPPKKDADVYINFESKSEKPSIKVKGKPNDPGYSYEINSPGFKESYNQQVVSYNKETQNDPITYTYEKQTQKEPVTYSYSHSSKDPGQTKKVQYVKKDPVPNNLVYNFQPDQGAKHHDSPKAAPAPQESDESNESSEAEDEGPSYEHSQYDTQPHHDKPSHAHSSSHSHSSTPSSHSHQYHPSHGHNSHPSTHSHQSSHPHSSSTSHPSTHSHQSSHPHSSSTSHPSTHSHQSSHPHSSSTFHPSTHSHQLSHPHSSSTSHPSTHSHQSSHPHSSSTFHPSTHSHQLSHPHSSSTSHPSSHSHQPSSNSHPSTHSYQSQPQHLKAEHKEQVNYNPTPSYYVVSHKPQYYTHSALSAGPKFPTLQEYVENIRFIPSYPSPLTNAAIRVDPNQQAQSQHQKPPQFFIQQTTPHARSEGTVVSEPVIYEKSKKIIIQEESPDEMHSQREQENLTAQMVGQEENSEEDFEKSYKEAAYGFPAYDRDSSDSAEEIYNHNYGEPHPDHSGEDTGHGHSPFEQYTEEGDDFPKSARLSYKDDRDKVQEDYYLGFSLNKPEIMTDRYQSKINYYKMFMKNKPEKLRVSDAKKKPSKYTVEPSFFNSAPRQKSKQSAQYKSAPKFEYDYDKESRDNSAHASRPLRHRSKTHFVEPQFQYGFEPIAIPRLDSELDTMASNLRPESEKPGTRKKVYKENWYIKKTSTSSKPS